MEKFKKGLFITAHVVIWFTFIVALFDSGIAGSRTTGDLFATYSWFFDFLYHITDYIAFPVQWVFEKLGIYDPAVTNGWFPITSSMELYALGWNNVLPPSILTGGIIWWIPIASAALAVFQVSFNYFYERVRNWVWNIVIEYIFHRRKAKLYEEALEKRDKTMTQLNTKYQAMAREAYSLKNSVITDEMTQVFNKRFFLNRLEQEFELCKQEKGMFSLIMIDIDFFKKLNDTYGHVSGDSVLKAVAAVLKRFTPEQCYPCRYGGEEFGIIMPRKNVNQAIEAARLMQEAVQQLRFEGVGNKIRVTISQGVCSVDFASPEFKHIQTFDNILEFADQELYRSKTEGRNRVSVYSVSGNNHNIGTKQ